MKHWAGLPTVLLACVCQPICMFHFCCNLTGPSGLHQRYFDEAVQDGKRTDNSPTMRRHDEDDDDSSSKCWALLCLHHSVACM